MRKLLYIFVTIIVVVAMGLFLPYFMGVLAQKKCQELTSTFANLARVEITVIDYRRHWFDSDATFAVKLRKPAFTTGIDLDKIDDRMQQWTVTAHILHGPIVISPARIKLAQAVIEAAVILSKEQSALLQREGTTAPLAKVSLGINLDGSSVLRVNGTPIIYKGEKVDFNLQGINIQVAFSTFLNRIKSTVELPGLDVTEGNAVLHVDGLVVNYAGIKNAFDLWVGQRQATLKSLVIKDGANSSLEIAGLTLNTSVVEEQRLAVARSTMMLDSLNFNGMHYTQNALVLEAADLDVATLAKLQGEVRKLSAMSEPSLQQGFSIVKYFGLLLNGGAALTIKQATTHTPWGEFSAFGQIVSMKANVTDFFALLDNMRGELNLRIEPPLARYLLTRYYERDAGETAESAAEQVKKQLNDWLQSGMLTIDGTAYKIKFKYDKKLWVNDQLVSITQVAKPSLVPVIKL